MKKKFIAMVCSLAMVLTMAPLFVNTSVAKAATPAVEIAGATLRTQGSQALRFLVNVTNYDETVTDFGIKLTVGGKTTTVKYSDAATKNVYSYDAATKTVGYTVAVTGIPASEKATAIKAVGFVTTTVAASPVETVEVSRNLEQVANAAGMTIDASGTAADLGGTALEPNDWNMATVSGIGDYVKKTVDISFKVRVQGILGSVSLPLQINDPSYSILKNVTIQNSWTTVTIPAYDLSAAGIVDTYPQLYFATSKLPTDATVYIKDLSISETIAGNSFTMDFSTQPTFSWNGYSSAGVTDEYFYYEYGSTGHEWESGYYGFPVIKVTLPSGKTLADYNALSLKYKSLAGDANYKSVKVFVAADEDSAKAYSSTTTSNLLGSVSSGNASTAWKTCNGYIISSSTVSADLLEKNSFYIAVNPNCGNKQEQGVQTKFGIDDITFIE